MKWRWRLLLAVAVPALVVLELVDSLASGVHEKLVGVKPPTRTENLARERDGILRNIARTEVTLLQLAREPGSAWKLLPLIAANRRRRERLAVLDEKLSRAFRAVLDSSSER